MPETLRTFLALNLPESQRHALVALTESLRPQIRGAKWVDSDTLHLTLAFLGDIPREAVDPLSDALRLALTTHHAPRLHLGDVGAFPNLSRPRVLWVGLDGPGFDALHRLQAAVVEAARSVGCPPADDRFHPHITVARFKPDRGRPPNLTGLVADTPRADAEPFLANEVVLYESSLTPHGPIYRAICTVKLPDPSS